MDIKEILENSANETEEKHIIVDDDVDLKPEPAEPKNAENKEEGIKDQNKEGESKPQEGLRRSFSAMKRVSYKDFNKDKAKAIISERYKPENIMPHSPRSTNNPTTENEDGAAPGSPAKTEEPPSRAESSPSRIESPLSTSPTISPTKRTSSPPLDPPQDAAHGQPKSPLHLPLHIPAGGSLPGSPHVNALRAARDPESPRRSSLANNWQSPEVVSPRRESVLRRRSFDGSVVLLDPEEMQKRKEERDQRRAQREQKKAKKRISGSDNSASDHSASIDGKQTLSRSKSAS